jgi:hypothetical protein
VGGAPAPAGLKVRFPFTVETHGLLSATRCVSILPARRGEINGGREALCGRYPTAKLKPMEGSFCFRNESRWVEVDGPGDPSHLGECRCGDSVVSRFDRLFDTVNSKTLCSAFRSGSQMQMASLELQPAGPAPWGQPG